MNAIYKTTYFPLTLGLIFLTLSGFSLFSLLQPSVSIPNITPPKPTQKTVSSSMDIASSHLFGRFQTVTESLPAANLSVVLQGIIFMEGSAARAIIGENNAAAKVYAVGDEISGGATIQTINKNNVVINQQGELRLLTLPVTPIGGK